MPSPPASIQCPTNNQCFLRNPICVCRPTICRQVSDYMLRLYDYRLIGWCAVNNSRRVSAVECNKRRASLFCFAQATMGDYFKKCINPGVKRDCPYVLDISCFPFLCPQVQELNGAISLVSPSYAECLVADKNFCAFPHIGGQK